MGPFEWLASHWTPDLEYRDRLASEVEEVAFEATTAGSKRGFLVGALVGVIVALMGIGAWTMNELQQRPSPAAERPQSREQALPPQVLSEELKSLREENAKQRKQLGEAQAAGSCPPCEKPIVQSKQPQPQVEVPAPKPPKKVVTAVSAKPETKAHAPAGPAARPIPSNCRREGDCDPVRP